MVELAKYVWENKDGINTMLDIAEKGICAVTYLNNLIKNRNQEKIYKDINKEVKKSKDKLELLDEDLLAELLIILENSIKNEDILVRNYIEIISELSNIDFLIFKSIEEIKINKFVTVPHPLNNSNITVQQKFDNRYYLSQIKLNENSKLKKIPKELIKKSIKKLFDLELISEDRVDISKNNDLYTQLGRNLYNASIKIVEK